MAGVKGKGRKLGRDLQKCKMYRDNHTREKNKIKRILKSNGIKAAEAYAVKFNLIGYLGKITNKQ